MQILNLEKLLGHYTSNKRLGLLEDWYRFKNNTLREMAADWCKENDVEYEE